RDQWQVTPDSDEHRRRSVYLFVRRNLRYPLFDVFDRPDTNASCPQRHESTTATQSLTLLNSAFSLECAEKLAAALRAAAVGSDPQQIALAYLRLYGRRATEDDIRLAKEFLERQQTILLRKQSSDRANSADIQDLAAIRKAALVDLCLALMNASEAIFL